MQEPDYPFYAIAGNNGVAVMSTFQGAEKLKKYIKRAKIRGFNQFELAEFWALATFQELSPLGKRLRYLRVNQAIFSKNLMCSKFRHNYGR